MQNSNNVIQFPTTQIDCVLCGSKEVTTRQEKISFPVSTRGKEQTLYVDIPVHQCKECDFEFTGPDADKIQHDAVCRFLNVMTPSEVREIRKKSGLTQSKFAEITGIGIASINRWEKGGVIQNPAMDNLLFLTGISGNLNALEARNLMPKNVIPIGEKFSAIRDHQDEIVKKSKGFAL